VNWSSNGAAWWCGRTEFRRSRPGFIRAGVLQGGNYRGRLMVSRGLDILSAKQAGDPLASRPDASFDCTSLYGWFTWDRPLAGLFSLALGGRGQLASDPVLVTQDLGLGGSSFLRGYNFNERSGDEGIMGFGELRYAWRGNGFWLPRGKAYVFADGGVVSNLEDGFANLTPAIVAQKAVAASSDPVLAGTTLTYTITVANTGNAPALGTFLEDAIPDGTTYVAGSTTLNGASVPDVGGVMPFTSSAAINSLNSPQGQILSGLDQTAVIVFQVQIDDPAPPQVFNQGIVTSVGIAASLTDDPGTPAVGDATATLINSIVTAYLRIRKTNTPGFNNEIDQ